MYRFSHLFLLAALLLPGVISAKPKGAKTLSYEEEFLAVSNKVVCSGWMNVDESHHLAGRVWSPEALNSRVVVVHRWCIACEKIDDAVKEFNSLARQYADTDFAFVTSYFPEGKHPRKEVEDALKRFKVTTSVYIGMSPMALKGTRNHCALYVTEAGTVEKWSIPKNNTDIKALAQYLKSHKEELVEASIRLAAEHAPGRALVQMKRLEKANPKKAKELKGITESINTPVNRQMADFEEKASALNMKPNPAAAKTLLAKLSTFAAQAPEALKDEIAELKAELETLK